MVYGVFPAAGIEGVAVGKEGLSAQFLDQVCHCLDIVRPEIGKVAQLTEVHFNGSEFPGKIDLVYSGPAAELLELDALADVSYGPEIGEIDGGRLLGHKSSSFVRVIFTFPVQIRNGTRSLR